VNDHESLLSQGIVAARLGERSTARRLLSEAVRLDPESEKGWLWLSDVLDTPPAKAYCLQRVLALNPDNHLARQGLAALGAPPPPAKAAPTPSTEPPPQALPKGEGVARQRHLWLAIIAGLSLFALCLVGALAYVTLGGSQAREEEIAVAYAGPTLLPTPGGTLRPTFTATATNTPTATPTPTDTPMPTATDTPLPTPTDTPTPTATRRRSRRLPAATATPTPRPTLPPRAWDPRLDALGVHIEPAPVAKGQPYWRLVEARWANEQEAGGKHAIYVEVVDTHGQRVSNQPVVMQWTGHSISLPLEDRPAPDWGVNFPMYATLGSYAVSVGGGPSDRVVGMGLGTAEAPAFTIHTCFYLIFRWVEW